ncbi:protoporphyrinogen oxidase [Atopococcus tabaci]|uniref:protoporphyrinogen oxidase n=1 Tax=Atopococcus tabaci TaxID=269774 RepID=UPI00240A633A|nr:protoporphyrinogen oxidase [Atopococcus tabaci]
MKRTKKRIAVIGSGITGLTTAYRIKQMIAEQGLPFELIVLESTIQTGGKIYSMKIGDNYFDLGPQSIDTRATDAIDLINDLSLQDHMVYSVNGKEDIYFYDKLHHFEFPTYKGIPAYRKDIFKYDMLTVQGKLTFLKETLMPHKSSAEEYSVSKYLRSRVGAEMSEHVVEPYFSQIFSSDIDLLGIRASKEPIYDMEKEHGSIIKGIHAHPEVLDGTGNYVTFKQGMSLLTNRLTDLLEDEIQYNKKVTEISKSIEGTYILDINNKEQMRVGAICIATEASTYKNMFTHDEALYDLLYPIQNASIGYALFSFPKGSIQREPEGFGVLSPRRNNSFITSLVWLNKKWPFLNNMDEELIGAYFGRTGEEFVMSLSNRQIEDTILKDIKKILHIENDPNYRVLKRWPDAVPQYTVQFEEKMGQIKAHLKKEYPGIYLAGNGIDGFGINSCIRQGNQISRLVVDHIKKRNCV